MATVLVLGLASIAAAAQPPRWVGDPSGGSDRRWDTHTVQETAGSITLAFQAQLETVQRARWRTVPRNATEGLDYVGTSGAWPSPGVDGEQVPAVTVEIIDDARGEGPEAFGVLLWLEGGGSGHDPPPADADACMDDFWCDYAWVAIEDDEGPERYVASGPAPGEAFEWPESGDDGGGAGQGAPTDSGGVLDGPSSAGTTPAPPPSERRQTGDLATPQPGPGFALFGDDVRLQDGAGGRRSTGGSVDATLLPMIAVAAGVASLALGVGVARRRSEW